MPKGIKIVSIGAGNLACNLIPALDKIGCNIIQVLSRTISSAKFLAEKVGADYTNEISELVLDADLYLLMINDDNLSPLLKRLPKLKAGQIIAHTSGPIRSTILRYKSSSYGSFYPLQTFSKKTQTSIANTPFLIHGSTAKTKRFLKMLARQLSPTVLEANDLERYKYHLAAVVKNNFINHLACLSNQYLKNNNLDPKVLDPITESTFQKIIKNDPCSIQSGPAHRNDVNIINAHTKLLSSDSTLQEIYSILSQSIMKNSMNR